MPEITGFTCRVCGDHEVKEIIKGEPVLGGPNSILGYSCKGCSVVFQDLHKFSTTSVTVKSQDVNEEDPPAKLTGGTR